MAEIGGGWYDPQFYCAPGHGCRRLGASPHVPTPVSAADRRATWRPGPFSWLLASAAISLHICCMPDLEASVSTQ